MRKNYNNLFVLSVLTLFCSTFAKSTETDLETGPKRLLSHAFNKEAINTSKSKRRKVIDGGVSLSEVLDEKYPKENMEGFQYIPMDIFRLLFSYLDVKNSINILLTHSLLYKKLDNEVYKYFVDRDKLFHILAPEKKWHIILKSHCLIPRSFKTAGYSSTQNFFFEIVDLSRSTALGNLEAAYHLEGLLQSRGKYYMSPSVQSQLSEKVKGAWQLKISDIEAADDNYSMKHILLGTLKQSINRREALNEYIKGHLQCDPRADLHIGRYYETSHTYSSEIKKGIKRAYRDSVDHGSSTGLVKLGYYYKYSGEVKKARKSFTHAIAMEDIRGYRGLYEIAKQAQRGRRFYAYLASEEKNKALQNFLASGDAYAYVLQARESSDFKQKQAIFEKAWQAGLTSREVTSNIFEDSMLIDAYVSEGYYAAVAGILDGNTSNIKRAIGCFEFTEHFHFVEKLKRILAVDFNSNTKLKEKPAHL